MQLSNTPPKLKYLVEEGREEMALLKVRNRRYLGPSGRRGSEGMGEGRRTSVR